MEGGIVESFAEASQMKASLPVTRLGPSLFDAQLKSDSSVKTNPLSGKSPPDAPDNLPDSLLPPDLEALRNFQDEFQLEDEELEKVLETILTQENSI